MRVSYKSRAAIHCVVSSPIPHLDDENEKCGKYDCVHLSINAHDTLDDCTELRHFMWVPVCPPVGTRYFTVLVTICILREPKNELLAHITPEITI